MCFLVVLGILKVHYKFDSNFSNKIPDISGNNFHAEKPTSNCCINTPLGLYLSNCKFQMPPNSYANNFPIAIEFTVSLFLRELVGQSGGQNQRRFLTFIEDQSEIYLQTEEKENSAAGHWEFYGLLDEARWDSSQKIYQVGEF